MLKNLLNGVEATSSILIQDSLIADGSDLLRGFIVNNSSLQNCMVQVACFQNSPANFRSRLKLDSNVDNIQYHDYCTDHRGWGKQDGADEIAIVLSVALEKNSKNVLVVDSLSHLILRTGFNQTYRQLHELIQTDIRVICLVHDDVLPNFSRNIIKLRHLFATCIQLSPGEENSDKFVVNARHIKKGGKVLRKSELYSVDSDGNVTFQEIIAASLKKDIQPVKEDVFPKELTTFKLDLGQNEKDARSKLVLPYLRPEGGGGKVFYEPDDADDWDDEDPDDDLDV